jgi:hypothetical protein
MKIINENKKMEIKDIFISELGFLMIKVFVEEEKVFKTYNVGKFNEKDNVFLDLIKKSK